ncbi:MAG: hypothetical protein Q9188_003092 [Gyalolechia gomerana]
MGGANRSLILRSRSEQFVDAAIAAWQAWEDVDDLIKQGARSLATTIAGVVNDDAMTEHQLPWIPSHAEQPQRSILERLVRFRFFRADKKIGAMSKSFKDCANVQAFFHFAARIVRLDHIECQPFAVSVRFPGKAYPTLVEWRDEQGYNDMIAEITREVQNNGDRLDVEIRVVQA